MSSVYPCRIVELTATGTAVTGKCRFWGMYLGTDGANDPEIVLYDNTSAAGTEIVPTTTYDASALGLNGGLLGNPVDCKNGIHGVITCAGTVKVSIHVEGGA